MAAEILNKSDQLRQRSDQLISKSRQLKETAEAEITRAKKLIANLKSGQ